MQLRFLIGDTYPRADQRFQSLPASPASSALSDVPQPPSKKRRVSLSSLSDDDDEDDDDEEDDEEDRPLAARMALKTSGSRSEKTRPGYAHRSGKKGPGKSAGKAHTAPVSLAPPVGEQQAEMNGLVNGTNGHDAKIKVEDKMDESQLTRLATGVTVDSGTVNSAGVCPSLCIFFLLRFLIPVKTASRKDRETISNRTPQRRDTDYSSRERQATALACYLDGPQNPFSEAASKNAAGVYRTPCL